MSISKKELQQIASLARLELAPGEMESLTSDLGSILDHIQELEAVVVDDVEPMRGVSDHAAPMRADTPGADPLERRVESFSPAWQERFFVVPRLAALDNDAETGS